MNIIKLAEALGVDTACKKEEVQKLRIELGDNMYTARNIIIESRIYKQIKLLVSKIEGVSNDR